MSESLSKEEVFSMILKRLVSTALFAPLALGFLGCARPESTSSKISVVIPSQLLSQTDANQASATGKLGHVVINVTGPGISEPIYMVWDGHEGDVQPAAFNLEIPKGDGRLLQILAVYLSETESMSIYYGDLTQSLRNDDELIDIPITALTSGNSIEGRVSGRYLTGDNSGPTGPVKVKIFPPGKPSLLVMKEAIFNGWFNFFMLDQDVTAKFGYELPDGKLLWGRPVSLVEPEFKASPSVLRVAMPVNYLKSSDSATGTSWRLRSANTRVFGWFGPGANSTNLVCRPDSVITDMGSVSALTQRTVGSTVPPVGTSPASLPGSLLVSSLLPTSSELSDPVNFYPGFRVKGGLELGHLSCNSGTEAVNKMTLPYLYTILLNGDDNRAGYNFGVFKNQLTADGAHVAPFTISKEGDDFQISGEINSGLLGSYFDRLKIFKRIGTDDWQFHEDSPPCQDIAQGKFGFVPAGDTALTTEIFSGTSLGLSASDVLRPKTATVAVCLSLGPQLTGSGFILNSWNFESFGSPMNSSPDHLSLEFFGNKIANDTCTPFKLEILSASSTLANLSTPINLNFSTIDASTKVYSDQYCGSEVFSPYSLNQASRLFYIKRTEPGSALKTLVLNSTLPTLTESLSFVDVSGTAYFLALTEPNINAFGCYSANYLAMRQNGSDTMVADPGGYYSVTLPSLSGLDYFYESGSPCSTPAGQSPSVSLDPTHLITPISFIYKGTSVAISLTPVSATGTPTFTGSFTGAENVSVIQPGLATRIRLSLDTSFGAESCRPMTLESVDSLGKLSPLTATSVISLVFNGSSTLPTDAGFYTDSNCTSLAGNLPTIDSGNAKSPLFYFRWVASEALSITGTVSAPTGLSFESFNANVGPIVLGHVIAYPSNGVSYTWPSTFIGYGEPVIKGEVFPVTLEARSPLGSLITDFGELNTTAAGLNLSDTYGSLTCGAATWVNGIGTTNCFLSSSPDYFSSILVSLNSGGGSGGYSYYYGPPLLRVTRAGEDTNTMTFLLSQNFSYSSNLCQPLMATRGQYTGTYFVTSKVSVGFTHTFNLTTAAAGVSAYYQDPLCSGGTITQTSLSGNQSAALVYVKLNGSALSFGSIRADFNDPTRAGASLTTYVSAAPTSFSKYSVSMSQNQYFKVCSPIMIVRTDANGAAIPAPSGETVDLSSDFPSGFYADSLCTSAVSSTPISTNETASIVYIKPMVQNFGSGTVTAIKNSSSEIGSVTGITVQP